MKIVVCDPISPKGIALLQQRPEFQVVVLPKRLTEAELLPVVADAVALVVRSETKVTRKVIEAAPKLRVVCTASQFSLAAPTAACATSPAVAP